MKIDSHTESGEYTISGNKVTITFSGETLKGTISGNKLSLPKNDNIMTFTKLSGEVAATTAMPSQDFVGKWGDGNDFIKINSISNDAIDFEWSVPNRGIETTGTAKIEGNRIVFVTNGGDFSGTMAFDGNGISLTVEKTGWPKVDAGAKWVYANKNEQRTKSGGDISLPPVIKLYQYSEEKYDTYEKNFRIWGWSKNGRVAYTYDVFESGTKETYALIFDFVQDKKIWSKGSEWGDWNGTGDDEGLPRDEGFYQAFRNACIENGIEFVQAKYRKLPIVHNNKTYNVVVDMDKRELNPLLGDPDIGGTDLLVADSYRIMVDTDGKRKVVHNAKTEYPYYNIFPLGYFLSPFENRALLVMGKHEVGGYNPTSFVGCDLDRGFAAAPVTFTVKELSGKDEVAYSFFDVGEMLNIAITPSAPVTDFRYISIGFNDDGKLYADRTLYERPRSDGGEIFGVFWQPSSIPQRGVSYMDGGQRKYLYLQENGIDGSIGLVEFTPALR
jgi:hypothetical protein